MRTKALALLVGAFFIAPPLSLHAQTYVSLVYGGVSCNAWTGRKAIEARAYEAWIFGFISSYNAYVFRGPNVIEGVELADIRDWIDAYCKRYPEEHLDGVARALVAEHAKKNGQ